MIKEKLNANIARLVVDAAVWNRRGGVDRGFTFFPFFPNGNKVEPLTTRLIQPFTKRDSENENNEQRETGHLQIDNFSQYTSSGSTQYIF